MMIFLLCFALLSQLAKADIYLHNPRGSNNRLAEATRERANDNRLFDSQNNERGGYNQGPMYYYVGSKLQIEWTNQHSCQSPNANCDLVIQYMCSSSLRDGSTINSIPTSKVNCVNNDCNTDARYGMHENFEYYRSCARRSRNKGIFIADQKVGQTAMNTRQNPNGQVSGYECSEERDYYPYFHPSPWIDIAVLTNNASKCEYYQSESENVKSRWYCLVPNDYLEKTGGLIPNNKEDCEKLDFNGVKGVWSESPAHGVAPPECRENQYTRDNHLGNTYGANPPVFNWTIPNNPNENCALRIRYNISTNDYGDVYSEANGDKLGDPAKVPIYSNVRLTADEAKARGYVFKNKPQVKLFSDLDLKLNLAIDTSQYGRVFQDRSHRFSIRKRPESLADKEIHNLNVRGKRGNIVQVYPSVEYDFIPNKLELSKNDFIHFQWTGSNTNPNNNAGQGTAGSDRNNVLILSPKKYNKGESYSPFDPLTVNGQLGGNIPDSINNITSTILSKDALRRLAVLQTDQTSSHNDELNDVAPYYDLGPTEVTDSGVVHYMCTRNNNFSNRDQKAQIISLAYQFSSNSFGVNGGILPFTDGEVVIEKNTFNDLTHVRVDVLSHDQIKQNPEFLNTGSQLEKQNLASNFVRLNPLELNLKTPLKIKIDLDKNNYKAGATDSLSVYRLSPDFLTMTKLKVSVDGNQAVVETYRGGTYVAKIEKNYGAVIGAVIGVVVLVIIASVIALVLYKNPRILNSMRSRARYAHRSLLNKV